MTILIIEGKEWEIIVYSRNIINAYFFSHMND